LCYFVSECPCRLFRSLLQTFDRPSTSSPQHLLLSRSPANPHHKQGCKRNMPACKHVAAPSCLPISVARRTRIRQPWTLQTADHDAIDGTAAAPYPLDHSHSWLTDTWRWADPHRYDQKGGCERIPLAIGAM
jgi:hypothetical protein